jgi:hypothetical protein
LKKSILDVEWCGVQSPCSSWRSRVKRCGGFITTPLRQLIRGFDVCNTPTHAVPRTGANGLCCPIRRCPLIEYRVILSYSCARDLGQSATCMKAWSREAPPHVLRKRDGGTKRIVGAVDASPRQENVKLRGEKREVKGVVSSDNSCALSIIPRLLDGSTFVLPFSCPVEEGAPM